MKILGIVLAIVGWASVGSGVVLSPGDILTAEWIYGAILHIDPNTGAKTVVSGCFTQPDCENELGVTSPVGSGPSFGSNATGPNGVVMRPGGDIFVCTQNSRSGDRVFKVDPVTGDRTALAGGLTSEGCADIALVPEPAGISVSMLPAWGGWLLAGVLLGLGIKGVRRGPAVG
jgi:hypothetical protein